MAESKQHYLVVGGIRDPQKTLASHNCRITWLIRKYQRLIPDMNDNQRCQHIIMHDPNTDARSLIGIAEAIHQYDRFDRVCAFHDDAQMAARKIAERLGLDFMYSEQVINNCRNKHDMRRVLERAGIGGVRYGLVTSRADVGNQLARFNGVEKLILKPLEGTGSEGVVAVDRERLEDFIDGADFTFPLMLEEFVHGREFSVEAFFESGRHHIIAITEKFKHRDSFIESGHLVPARIPERLNKRIASYVNRCLTALGVSCGATHTEVIASGSRIVLVETHTRSGGDQIPCLVEHAFGIDLHELMALQAMGLKITVEKLRPKKQHTHACIRYLVKEESEAAISKIRGVARAKSLPGVEEVALSVKPGERLPAVKHSFDRAGWVLAVGDTPDNALSSASAAIETIEIIL